MGESKRRRAEIDDLKARSFPMEIVARWERTFCIPFAIALARRTKWLLHVDWLTDLPNFKSNKVRIPLRAYVGTDGDSIFDPRGLMTIATFNAKVTKPIAAAVGPMLSPGQLYSGTRTYDDEDLTKLIEAGIKVNDAEIAEADKQILANVAFLSAIPPRCVPTLPAYEAGRYTWGRCALYAHQLGLTKLLPVATLHADKIDQGWSLARPKDDGYIHSFVLHPDGSGEDSWGRVSVEKIAARFHLVDWHLKLDTNQKLVSTMLAGSEAEVREEMARAQALIDKFARN